MLEIGGVRMFKFLKNLKYTNKLILFLSTALFIFGLVMIFSASNISAFMRYHATPYHFLIKQSIFLVAGLVGFFIIINVDSSNYNKYAWLGLIVCIGLLLFAYFYGPDINDSKGWINLGFFNFQPSEVVKVVIIAWLATFFEIKKLGINKIAPSLFAFFIALAEAGLVVLGKDFGTAAIIMLIVYLMYYLIPVKLDIKLKTYMIISTFIVIGLLGYYFANTSSFQRQTTRIGSSPPSRCASAASSSAGSSRSGRMCASSARTTSSKWHGRKPRGF